MPPISIAAPSSFAAVNLLRSPQLVAHESGKRNNKGQDICIPRKNVPERDGVSAHAKDAPLFRDGFGETCDGRLGRGIVGLTDVAVKSGRAGNVDNTAILNRGARLGLDAHERRSGANETERRSNVDFQDDVPRIVGHCVQHTVIGEAGFRKPCQ